MKKLMAVVMVLAMMLSAMAAMAQSDKQFTITPRIAADFALDKDTKDYICSGQYGILADIDIASLPVGFEAGFLFGNEKKSDCCLLIPDVEEDLAWDDVKTKVKSWNIPLMVTYAYPFAENFYAKAGVGVNFYNVKTTIEEYDPYWGETYKDDYKKTKTNFGFKLGLGYKFASNFSAELLYEYSGKVKMHDKPIYRADKGGIDEFKTSFIQLNVGYSF